MTWVKIMTVDSINQGKTMNSHNPKPDTSTKVAAVRIESDQNDKPVVQPDLPDADQLAISDDDFGGDPYNSTGEYVILKAKLNQAE